MNLVSFDALVRIRDTRRRIDALMWAARAEVIRAQLRTMRGSVYAGCES